MHCNRRAQSAVVSAIGNDALIERFVKIAVQHLKYRCQNKILIKDLGKRKSAFFYNSKLRKLFDNALERKEKIFKYRNEYSSNYLRSALRLQRWHRQEEAFHRTPEPVQMT